MTTTSTITPKGTRAALYARVSTTGHGQDVGLQLDELRAVAGQRGWHVVAEHVDDGVSGAATSRPALDAMMEQARRGKLDLVVVWKLDRLGGWPWRPRVRFPVAVGETVERSPAVSLLRINAAYILSPCVRP